MMYGLSFFVVLTSSGVVHTGQGNIRFPSKIVISQPLALVPWSFGTPFDTSASLIEDGRTKEFRQNGAVLSDEISGRSYARPMVERSAGYRVCSVVRASAYPQRARSHSSRLQGSSRGYARNSPHAREEAISSE